MNRVAVIVLNYNGQHLLGACLNSLRRLTVPAEIVVADNGSTDGSLAYLRDHFPEARVLAFGANLGFAAAYNRALAEVNTPWAVMLNNDACLEPAWLELLLATAERAPRAAILGGKLLFGGVPGRVVQCAGACFTDAGTAFEIGWGQPDTGQYDQPGLRGAISGAALLIRREVFGALGGFDAAYFAYLEDVDLCWRAWLAGYEVRYVPQAVAFHHFGATSGGRASPFRIRYMQRNRLANMVKHLELSTFPAGLMTSVAYDGYRLVEYTSHRQGGGLRALLVGTLDFLRDWRTLLDQRQQIQRTRCLSDKVLREQRLMVSALTAFQEYRRLAQVAQPT